jgi:DNA-binding NtrC family response regulator
MSRLGNVLVLDDDQDVLTSARMALAPEADRVDVLSRLAEVDAALERQTYDVVLMDMNFAPGEHSGEAGLRALEQIRSADADVSVVLMTVYGGVALAVETLKRGAVDFVLKPWRNAKLVEALAAAATLTRSRRGSDSLNLDEMERHAIQRALDRYDGNISQAAAALGLTRPALYRRIAKHGL